MKNQNNSLEKNSIFSKIKSWWYNIFHKSSKAKENLNNTQDATVSENNKLEETNMFDECRKKNERRMYLLQLQNKYENKIISESEINEKDKIDLEALYVEQIRDLKIKVKGVESKIQKIS